MTERWARPPFSPESLEFADIVVTYAAQDLREQTDALAASANPSFVVDTKISPEGIPSEVTDYDKETEAKIGNVYKGTSVRVKGEEEQTTWPEGKTPSLILDVDPIDGTSLFTEYLRRLIAWYKIPEAERPPRPVAGWMVSAGGVRPGSNVSEFGALAAPALSPDGIIRWNAGPGVAPVRIEPDGGRYTLPLAHTLPNPETGGVILAASDTTASILNNNLPDKRHRVITLRSAVGAALCVMDPSIFERLRPGELNGDPIVGVAMQNPRRWDIAGTLALAPPLGHFISAPNGEAPTFEPESKGLVIALGPTIGRTLVRALRQK
ncbi:MAG TPA: hypothetical protein VFB59_01525 [Candidatus Saccharimonadales bacterium]|nr:hypothetical protein [Candidatus Saccharimonadales bacterium]